MRARRLLVLRFCVSDTLLIGMLCEPLDTAPRPILSLTDYILVMVSRGSRSSFHPRLNLRSPGSGVTLG
eukprot:3729119-Pyramimonas_sp.AAC.1